MAVNTIKLTHIGAYFFTSALNSCGIKNSCTEFCSAVLQASLVPFSNFLQVMFFSDFFESWSVVSYIALCLNRPSIEWGIYLSVSVANKICVNQVPEDLFIDFLTHSFTGHDNLKNTCTEYSPGVYGRRKVRALLFELRFNSQNIVYLNFAKFNHFTNALFV